MRIEVENPPRLSPAQELLVDQHSFRNVICTMGIELLLLGRSLERAGSSNQAVRSCNEMVEQLGGALRSCDAVALGDRFGLLIEALEVALRETPFTEAQREVLTRHIADLRAVLEVAGRRIEERVAWKGTPYQWRAHAVRQIITDLRQVFMTIAQVSHGRYGVVFAPPQGPRDYLLDFRISSVDGDTITMPSVLTDVLRDLTANARKYSSPGSRICATLSDTGERVEMEVSDEGRGIPADELLSVVEFGVRGSNVQDVDTRGGGMGLTKAVAICAALGGRTWIDSEVGQGTTITLHIPRPAQG